MESLIAAAVGLMGLGLIFCIMDHFLVNLMRKMYSDPGCWDEALNATEIPPDERKSLVWRKRHYDACMAHHFRRGGIVVFVIGSLLLVTAGLLHISR